MKNKQIPFLTEFLNGIGFNVENDRSCENTIHVSNLDYNTTITLASDGDWTAEMAARGVIADAFDEDEHVSLLIDFTMLRERWDFMLDGEDEDGDNNEEVDHAA